MNEAEVVRRRPGMYVGDFRDGSGLDHMVSEVLADAVDEFLAGRCSRIEVTLEADGAITIEDDGRGMRTDLVNGRPFPETALTTRHDAPTLDGHAPHEHVGLRGVGLLPVCALSTYLTLDVRREGSHFRQRFERGQAVSALDRIAATRRTGTRITFLPDSEIFSLTSFDTGVIGRRLEELTYLLPGLEVTLQDHRQLHFHHPRGVAAWVDAQLRVDPNVTPSRTFEVQEQLEDIRVEAAASWGNQWHHALESFANINRTTAGGTHDRGLLLGMVAGLRSAAPEACRRKRTAKIEAALSSGLVAIVCVRLDDLEFGDPTRSRLATPRVRDIVKKVVAKSFDVYLRQEPELLRRLAEAVTKV